MGTSREERLSSALADRATHYCAGCGHGIAHRLICEVIDELGIREKVVGIAPVGCAVLAYDYFNFDVSEAPHGRAPSIATGLKRTQPHLIAFTYQGDGDLAAIGLSEIMHTANRNENISVFFVNNAVYGMTGGQMAPTTMEGQVTSTTHKGRDAAVHGWPVKVAELIAALEPPYYVERTAVNSPQQVIKTRNAVKKAFLNQMEGRGFSLVEILSACPTYWNKTAVESVRWIEEHMTRAYPLGIKKVKA